MFKSSVSVQLENDSSYNLCGNEFQGKGEEMFCGILQLPVVNGKLGRIKKSERKMSRNLGRQERFRPFLVGIRIVLSFNGAR